MTDMTEIEKAIDAHKEAARKFERSFDKQYSHRDYKQCQHELWEARAHLLELIKEVKHE
jgi:hypothetical protein